MRYLLGFLLLVLCWPVFSQKSVNVDFSTVVKEQVASGVASANLCWLLDSDLNRPNKHQTMAEAITEMGCGSLRFPYGHLADNYLWHTPPYADVEGGLRPRVAATSQAPARWSWAVDSLGSFPSAMDFDEYMQLCQQLDIVPLVVVNVFSHKYNGGPSMDELVECAAEWVRYAQEMNYQVAYWQIGNEVDHHPDVLTREEYVACYKQIVRAMKAVDSDVKTGPGILSNVGYFSSIIEENPDLIDFVSCHQYMWKYKDTCQTYDKWLEYEGHYIPNVKRMQKAVEKSSKPNMDIVITETGVTPPGTGTKGINNMFKALWWFEILMNEMTESNVTYSYNWGTHSPWEGDVDNEKDDLSVLLRVDDNSRKPTAEIIKLVNDNMLDQLVNATTNNKYLRTYATSNTAMTECSVFIMNKSEETQYVNVGFEHLSQGIKSFVQQEFMGNSPDDRNPKLSTKKRVRLSNDLALALEISPLSVLVLRSR